MNGSEFLKATNGSKSFFIENTDRFMTIRNKEEQGGLKIISNINKFVIINVIPKTIMYP